MTQNANDNFQKMAERFQQIGKDNFDAVVRSYGELNKGWQTIAASWTDYSKCSLEQATRPFEQLACAKSLEQAIEIQTDFAKKAYEDWCAEASKLGKFYASMAREAYNSVGQVVAKTSPQTGSFK